MTLLPRKVTFQLTPLLDLLLIVIFAQYLDIREESAQRRQSADRSSAELAETFERSRQQQHRLENELAETRQQLREQDQTVARLNASLDRAKQQQDRLRKQRDLLARQLATLFGLPDDVLAKMLQPLRDVDRSRRPETTRTIRKRIETLGRQKPHRIVRHVVKFEEMLKRCDIWEVHVDRRNVASLTIAGKSFQFRYSVRPLKLTGDRRKDLREQQRYFRELTENFERELYSLYKGLPQPKNIIIVLISKDSNTPEANYDAAKEGIRNTAGRISRDSGARIDVIYTDLGRLPAASPTPTKD